MKVKSFTARGNNGEYVNGQLKVMRDGTWKLEVKGDSSPRKTNLNAGGNNLLIRSGNCPAPSEVRARRELERVIKSPNEWNLAKSGYSIKGGE